MAYAPEGCKKRATSRVRGGGTRGGGIWSCRGDTDSIVPSAASVTSDQPGATPRHRAPYTLPRGPALVVLT